MTTVTAAARFVSLSFVDWQQSKRVELADIPANETIGSVLREAVDALRLPVKDAYHALFKGRQLNNGTTLDEAGILEDGELQVIPEVTAGHGERA